LITNAYMKNKYEQSEEIKMYEYPQFHVSEATFSKNDKDVELNNELLEKYQKLAINIELSKKESEEVKTYIPSYAKLEITVLIIFSIFAIISMLITGFMGNISLSMYFLIIGLGCLVGFLPLLYVTRKVV